LRDDQPSIASGTDPSLRSGWQYRAGMAPPRLGWQHHARM